MPIPHLGNVKTKPKNPYVETPKNERQFGLETVPTVYPTVEEFGNPVDYVASLRSLGEKYGMVKVVPPSSWTPKFSLDIGGFNFDCRSQVLSRLDAESRVSLEWLDRMEKYHRVYHKGLSISDKFPFIEGQVLNLYKLKLLRDASVGWYEVCSRLGINTDHLPTIVRCYSNLVWPFDQFVRRHNQRLHKKRGFPEPITSPAVKKINVAKIHSPPTTDDPSSDEELSAKHIFDHESSLDDDTDVSDDVQSNHSDGDDVASCPTCRKVVDEDARYCFCVDCKEYYHYVCLEEWPITTKDYICSRCLVEPNTFYFNPGKNYTLPEFQDVADEVRKKYVPETLESNTDASEALVEKTFWQHVSSPESSLTVEYGADVQCDVKGSGFPTIGRDANNKYARHPWNLNNFPQMKASLFRYINTDYSGVTLPWAYVGMIFSAFCWHAEDHYTYSINYQFFGDTKTWYAIPGEYSDKFERLCKNLFPELFQIQPNLLHERSTMVSPELIRKHGIPCYAVDQRPGQFIVTFPKAYHAGFNHGFNYNEAVNFAPPDWVPYGLEAVKTYKTSRHAPIFSHDMLLLKVAEQDRSVGTTKWLITYIRDMIQEEEARLGITLKMLKFHETSYNVTHFAADAADESEYTCHVCKCLAYLSRAKLGNAVYCHDHVPVAPKSFGANSTLVLDHRYTVPQLKKLYQGMSDRLDLLS